MNTNQNTLMAQMPGGYPKGITAMDMRTATQAVKQSVVRDQLDRAEKALSQLESTIAAHRERIDTALQRVPETDDYCKPPNPCPSTGCDLGDRICRLVDAVETAQSAVAAMSQRVCL